MTKDASILFTPFDLRGFGLANRIVMAPLTRSRASHDTGAPHELNAAYYAQRATAGLIIGEATNISPTAKGYAWTPGIFTAEQIAGWRLVTDAVHVRGGKIFLQLWHVGRISHPSLQPGGQLPVAPSAVRPQGRAFTEEGYKDLVTPRALELNEIPGVVEDYRRAARNAITAGFDGVEIHAANGYLIDQFLRDGANRRTDAYGGSVANRLRFALEAVEAVTGEAGAARTGIRISPINTVNDLDDSDPPAVFFPLVRELSRFGLAYVHVIEGITQGPRDNMPFDFAGLRRLFDGPWMVNNGYTRDMAVEAIQSGYADLVAFGRPFIANPDLVERLRRNAPLNELDRDTLFGGGARGYTDYPTLPASAAQ
jgi:N-ethylmaleimide reductase